MLGEESPLLVAAALSAHVSVPQPNRPADRPTNQPTNHLPNRPSAILSGFRVYFTRRTVRPVRAGATSGRKHPTHRTLASCLTRTAASGTRTTLARSKPTIAPLVVLLRLIDPSFMLIDLGLQHNLLPHLLPPYSFSLSLSLSPSWSLYLVAVLGGCGSHCSPAPYPSRSLLHNLLPTTHPTRPPRKQSTAVT